MWLQFTKKKITIQIIQIFLPNFLELGNTKSNTFM